MTADPHPPTPWHSAVNLETAKGLPCPWCGVAMRRRKGKAFKSYHSRDHVVPASKGGKLTKRNRVTVCGQCNGDKGARTLEEWLSHLRAVDDYRASYVEEFLVLWREWQHRCEEGTKVMTTLCKTCREPTGPVRSDLCPVCALVQHYSRPGTAQAVPPNYGKAPHRNNPEDGVGVWPDAREK